MDAFPAYYPLTGRRIVIAGDGDPAEAKARLFAASPAEVVKLAPAAALDPKAYEGADLIFVASFDADFTLRAVAAARAGRPSAPLNAADHPELSDFHTPAIIDRGAVVAAIGTAGAAPILAALLRAEVEARLPEGVGALAAILGSRRDGLRAAFPDLARRRAFLRTMILGPMAQATAKGELQRAEQLFDEALGHGVEQLGRVTFIDGAASPDLVSVRAMRALNIADVVVSGPDGETIANAYARRDAARRPMSEIELVAEEALAGRLATVVGVGVPRGFAETLVGQGIPVEHLRAAGT